MKTYIYLLGLLLSGSVLSLSAAGMARSDYDILGVTADATSDEITKAYKKMAMKWHPDKAPAGDKAKAAEYTEKFKEIENAYDRLVKNPGTNKAPKPRAETHSEANKQKAAMTLKEFQTKFPMLAQVKKPGLGGISMEFYSLWILNPKMALNEFSAELLGGFRQAIEMAYDAANGGMKKVIQELTQLVAEHEDKELIMLVKKFVEQISQCKREYKKRKQEKQNQEILY